MKDRERERERSYPLLSIPLIPRTDRIVLDCDVFLNDLRGLRSTAPHSLADQTGTSVIHVIPTLLSWKQGTAIMRPKVKGQMYDLTSPLSCRQDLQSVCIPSSK